MTTVPSYVKEKIEAVLCRGCGAKGAACIAPQRRTVLASVAFEGRDYRTEFCYERVYDYFESFRPPEGVVVSIAPDKPPVNATTACDHTWIRYVLDGSALSRAQMDGVDDRGRPYRDLPMRPMETFAYAATIGSDFAKHVVTATCRDCGAELIGGLPREEISR